MHELWEGKGVNSVYPYAVADLLRYGRKVPINRPDAVDNFTVEINPGMFILSEPRKRLVTSYGRPVNIAFALAEVLHILAGRRDVEMLEFYNSTIGQFSDDGELFNAAYGHRMRSSFGHDQIEDCVMSLMDDHTSRQATIVISNPVDDKGWNRYLAGDEDDPTKMKYTKKQTKDRACNLVSHMLIRDGKLDWMQVMRSNDAIWGTPYNFMQFTHLQEYIAARCGVEVGSYTYIADSLHIYSHHFEQAAGISHFDLYEKFAWNHAMLRPEDNVLNMLLREELAIRQGKQHMECMEEAIGEYWTAVLMILDSWRLYKEGRDYEAYECLVDNADPVYAAAQMRFYYQNRWWKTGDSYRHIRGSIESRFSADVVAWIFSRVDDNPPVH